MQIIYRFFLFCNSLFFYIYIFLDNFLFEQFRIDSQSFDL